MLQLLLYPGTRAPLLRLAGEHGQAEGAARCRHGSETRPHTATAEVPVLPRSPGGLLRPAIRHRDPCLCGHLSHCATAVTPVSSGGPGEEVPGISRV